MNLCDSCKKWEGCTMRLFLVGECLSVAPITRADLAAQGDDSSRWLAESLSGLADGANDLAEVIAHLRATCGASEAVLAEQEAVERWREWRTVSKMEIVGLS